MAAVASVALPRASCRRLARGGEHRAPLAPRFSRTRLVYRIFRVSAAEATTLQGSSDAAKPLDLESSKRVLRRACYLTDRGAASSTEVRGVVTEAQVTVESFCSFPDFKKMEGLWRLIYTSAFDVTSIVELGKGTPLKVGGIYQQYSSLEEGKVQNIVEFGLPPFLEADRGLRFAVEAGWEVRSPQRIALSFQNAGVSDIRITSLLESFIAPAMLPRDSLQQAILLAIKEFAVTVPLMTRAPVRADGRPAGKPSLQVTYLDEDMLIGRAIQGSFIFVKDRLPS